MRRRHLRNYEVFITFNYIIIEYFDCYLNTRFILQHIVIQSYPGIQHLCIIFTSCACVVSIGICDKVNIRKNQVYTFCWVLRYCSTEEKKICAWVDSTLNYNTGNSCTFFNYIGWWWKWQEFWWYESTFSNSIALDKYCAWSKKERIPSVLQTKFYYKVGQALKHQSTASIYYVGVWAALIMIKAYMNVGQVRLLNTAHYYVPAHV